MRWVLEDYTLCIYIIYISEHYVNKLEALVLVLLFQGRRGIIFMCYQQSLYTCIKYIEQQHLGHTGLLILACVRLWEATTRHKEKNTTHNRYPGKTLNTLATLSALGKHCR